MQPCSDTRLGLKTPSAAARLRLACHELSQQASRGADVHVLAAGLGKAWSVSWEPGAPVALVRASATELMRGACSLARWLDPVRPLQVVPPLSAVLLQVVFRCAHRPPLLSIRFLLPADVRAMAGRAWAEDVSALLHTAGIDCHLATLACPFAGASDHDRPVLAPIVGTWGCMSLLHEFEQGHETRWLTGRPPAAGVPDAQDQARATCSSTPM